MYYLKAPPPTELACPTAPVVFSSTAKLSNEMSVGSSTSFKLIVNSYVSVLEAVSSNFTLMR